MALSRTSRVALRVAAGRPPDPVGRTPPLLLLLPRRRPRARPGEALPSPAAAGTRGPPARVGLARAGTPGPERGVGPDVTSGGGGAPAIPFLRGRRLRGLVRCGRQGRRRRDRIGSRRRGWIWAQAWALVAGLPSARWWVRHVGSWVDPPGFYPCLVLDSAGNSGGNPRSPWDRAMAVLLRRSPSSGHRFGVCSG